MDKYEFNIKVEQIKKLVNKGDFETAMKIADTIDGVVYAAPACLR